MLGHNLPLSSIAPARIMAVAVTKVTPKIASGGSNSQHWRKIELCNCTHRYIHRISGISEFAIDGWARTSWNTASDRSPKIGFVVRD